MTPPKPGTQGWLDLTVDDAPAIRDFYADVLGWTPHAVSMGDYDDWSMLVDDKPVGGVCHRRGENDKLPPVWVPYFVVEALGPAVEKATGRGAEIIDERKQMVVLRDPAGAVFALWQGSAG